MTVISLAAVALYFMIMLACLAAANVAHRHDAPRGHTYSWLFIGSFFVILAVNRVGNFEHRLRESLRTYLRESSVLSYDNRWDIQAPLFVLIVLSTLLLAFFAWRIWPRSTESKRIRYLRAAQIALLAFVPLFGLRLISLHAFDQLLYSGPIRLNWVLDGLLTGIVGVSALLYISRLQQKLQGRS